jgi:putative ABC transport system permease protein
MRNLWTELRFARRNLSKTPVLTAVVLVTLALGIGATTAIFSVVDAVLLTPIPYPEPDRLVALIDTNPEAGLPRFSTSPPDFLDWRDQSTSFEHMTAITRSDVSLTGDGDPEQLLGASVTGDFFGVLGVPPRLGRGFTPEDNRPGAQRVVVLSHALWQRRFGGDPGILGRVLTLDGEPHTVVGVAAESFRFPSDAEVWRPLALEITDDMRGGHWLSTFARLRPGVTLEEAQTEMETIARRLAEAYPDTNTGWSVNLFRLDDLVVEDVQTALWVLMATVGLVLLIACANVASVLLARNAGRQREVAIRSALGAGRGRLLGQFLAESVLLALGGGALGLVLAYWGTRLLVSLHPDALPSNVEVGIDGTVLLFAVGVSLLTGLLFGLAPGFQATDVDLRGSLQEGGRGAKGSGRRARRLRDGLVLAEVALAVILLLGAGLLLRSLVALQGESPGFEPNPVLTLRFKLPETRYGEEEQQVAFYRELDAELASLPGAEVAGVGYPLPFSGSGYLLTFAVEGRPKPEPNQEPAAHVRFVTPRYLEALGVPLLQGRRLAESDRRDGPRVALINQRMAEQMWPGEDPRGKRFTFGDPGDEDTEWIEVVGMVGDVRDQALDREPEMETYVSLYQFPRRSAGIAVRSAGPAPATLAGSAQRVLHRIDKDLPAYRVEPMSAMIQRSMAPDRFGTALLGLFAALALALAAVGIYGVVGYHVARRTREVGVRLALGAARGHVLRLVLRQAMGPVLLGAAAGLAVAPFLTRLLESLLYRVGALDPVTFAAVPVALAAVGFLACLLPALRATRIDPLEALREE